MAFPQTNSDDDNPFRIADEGQNQAGRSFTNDESPESRDQKQNPKSENLGNRIGPRRNEKSSEGPKPEKESSDARSKQYSSSPIPDGVDQRSCAIIGSVGSGKTCLLLGVGRACFLPGDDNFDLEFVPESNVSSLMEEAVNIITGEATLQSTLNPNNYSFDIHAKSPLPSKWGKLQILRANLNMTIHDGPGGALFPEEIKESKFPKEQVDAYRRSVENWQSDLIPKVRQANSMIFCVDASEPNVALLEKRLPRLISDIAEFRQVAEEYPEDQSRLDRLRWWRPTPTRQVPKRCLNVDRFLLLLNKIDRFSLRNEYDVSAREIALSIDPVEQAKTLLSLPLLNMIRFALKPEAKFAIGITSSLGFLDINGQPLADEDGRAQRGPGESDDDIYRKWIPFGIRDALFFIATGKATGTVSEVKPRDLHSKTQPALAI